MRLGVDFGGTKIEAAALDARGGFLARVREPNPGAYDAALETVGRLVARIDGGDAGLPVGICGPGSISPATGRMRNANSVWLNGRPFREDLEAFLGRPVRFANDADCFTLSEAADGAAAGAGVVFGAILGTGVGGGVVVDGRLVSGRNGVGGEWGHAPLPWPTPDEAVRADCWCGRAMCMETFVSGTGFRADHARSTGRALTGEEIAAAAAAGDPEASASLDRYIDRLGRGLAMICDVIDPDAIVLGGGMSNVAGLYARLPDAIGRRVFSDVFTTPVLKAVHGDSSGVRGAARLWP